MNENNDSIILIFGGSGFIGKSITNHLNIKYSNKLWGILKRINLIKYFL